MNTYVTRHDFVNKRGFTKTMHKRLLSIFLAILLFMMPLSSALAGVDDPVDLVIAKLNSMTAELRNMDNDILENLIETIKTIDGQNIILNEAFDIINGTKLEERLNNVGITKESLEKAAEIFREEGYEIIKGYLTSGDIDEYYGTLYTWLNTVFNKTIKDENAPLKELDENVRQKFGGWYDFLNLCYDNQSIIKTNVTITYDEEDKDLTVSEAKVENIKEQINDNIKGKVDDFTVSDVETVINVIKACLSVIPEDSAFNFAKAAEALGFNVIIIPSEDDDDDRPGGGGVSTPDKPEIEEPSSANEPVRVVIPDDAVKVSVKDGKTTVTLDEGTVNDLLKLLDKAEAKDEGQGIALSFELTGKNITNDVTLIIPEDLVSKALEKGAAIEVKTSQVTLNIPASSIDVEDELTINITSVSASEALEGIGGTDNMRPVGSAAEISVTSGNKDVTFKDKITLRFNIKGIAVNIDKLGIYYVNEETGQLEFVGGKVDRKNSIVYASVPHLSTYVMAEYNKTFSDIQTHWAKNYIESMAAKHIIDGRSETIFMPDDKVTRAEFAKIIVNTLELDLKSYKGIFEDVSYGAWYADYIQTAYEAGLIQGKVAGKVFDPNGEITREEMMTIIGRALVSGESTSTAALSPYKDADQVAEYAKPYVAYLITERLVSGYPDSTIRPKASTTRAEAVKIIYGVYNR